MKSILLHINDDKGLEARTQVAFDLARAFDGHVTCLQTVSYEILALGDFYGTMMASAIPVIRENAEKLRSDFEANLANEDASWEWVFKYGLAEERLLELSAINDIVVMGPNNIGDEGARPSGLVGDIVTRARTPVLVVPNSQKSLDVNGPALVAWNGSAEACIALRAAVPMLAKASGVHLVTVSEESDGNRTEFPPLNGVEYLSRHGISAELAELPRGDQTIADAIMSAAKARNCEYVVMGAYGHRRLAEMLLGGVTRSSLTNPALPILLAH